VAPNDSGELNGRTAADVIVVGSGVSGAQAAALLVESGCNVVMLDGGYRDEKYAALIQTKSFAEIRRSDWQQHRYFLGDEFEGIDLGPVGAGAQITPPRLYVLDHKHWNETVENPGFVALQSLALGGLAAAWGAVSFPFTDHELEESGLRAEEIAQYYDEIARCVGISGDQHDDLSGLRGEITPLRPALKTDSNATAILDKYYQKRLRLRRDGVYLGRPLMAVLTEPLGNRERNSYTDMDFWSNFGASVYRPESTVTELRQRQNFSYRRVLVTRFDEGPSGLVHVEVQPIEEKTGQNLYAKILVLAAGTLGTARIVLRSFGKYDLPVPLTCNSHTYVPCILPGRFGKYVDPSRHSLAQLTMILDPTSDGRRLVQGQFYSYGSLLMYKLLKQSPLPLRESVLLFQRLAPYLGIWVIQHEDVQTADKFVVLRRRADGSDFLEIAFCLDSVEEQRQRTSEAKMIRAMRRLGCWAIKRIRTAHGSSAHYASTFPMREEPGFGGTSLSGRLHNTQRVYVADGSSLRYLPAKGPSLTLMANARRVAATALRNL